MSQRFGRFRGGAAIVMAGLALAGPHAPGTAWADSEGVDADTGPASVDRGSVTRSGPAAQRPRSGLESPTSKPDPSASTAPRVRPAASSRATEARPWSPRPSASQPDQKRSAPAGTEVPAATRAVPSPAAATATGAPAPQSGPIGVSAATASSAAPNPVKRPAPVAAMRAAAQPTCPVCQAAASAPEVAAVPAAVKQVPTLGSAIDTFFQKVSRWLSGLPRTPFSEAAEGVLLLVRRSLFNDAPTANPAQLGQTTTDITGTIGALDPEGDEVFYTLLTQPRAGSVAIDPTTGAYTYTPAALGSYGALDQFTVELADAGPHLHLFHQAKTAVTVPVSVAPSADLITFSELDTPDGSQASLAVRVDKNQPAADGIKVDAGSTFTLTLPGPTTSYSWVANKPGLVDIAADGTKLTVTAKTPGFLGLAVTSNDTKAARYVGIYIADPATHSVPDLVTGYVPVGSVTLTNATGDAFLEKSNFRTGVAPIDYLYIYDQGGPDYTDGNTKGLLTQAVRHGLIPVVVFYNIQAVSDAKGDSTGVVEGWDAAYQAINDYNHICDKGCQKDPKLFTGYMKRYFTKMAADFTLMNEVGVPVQVVMEPDFLGYMASRTPAFQASTFVPNPSDRTLNTANVSAIYDAGLLTRGTDPAFDNNLAGLVQAINYYTATKMPNLRIGWKTNIWAVPDQRNYTLGLLHMTDTTNYPWDRGWGKPIGFELGQDYIEEQATQVATFLKKVGVTTWKGSAERIPFLAIDKYGVDGAYTFDPQVLSDASQTLAFGNLTQMITGAYTNRATTDEADFQKYYGMSKADFTAFYEKYNGRFDLSKTAPDVQAVYTTLQNAVKADPNLALWFFNADQWNNYLLLVKTLSTTLGGTKVMLWQIPQGHINGSTDLPGRDLPNNNAYGCPSGKACGFEDSATSYFFGDTFTATGGRLAHFSSDKADDPGVSSSGNTIIWGEHMTMAGQYGAMSVLFGAGLGVSTRGAPTPGGDITDLNFWADKATAYLTGRG